MWFYSILLAACGSHSESSQHDLAKIDPAHDYLPTDRGIKEYLLQQEAQIEAMAAQWLHPGKSFAVPHRSAAFLPDWQPTPLPPSLFLPHHRLLPLCPDSRQRT